MSFTNPAALALLALAIPIVLLHILRPRRPEVVVSSTFLWKPLAEPVSAASPWQKLRPSLLLVLQLLAVALLALAVARPVRLTAASLAKHTVFIVDDSGSMAANDGKPDRIGAARARAQALRKQLPAGGQASVVVASAQPRVLLSASDDGRAFTEALAAIPPPAGTADFVGAFNLAESLETPGVPIGFVLLSDGGLSTAEQNLLPPGTRYEKIGARATNRAITRLVVEPRGSGLRALVTLRNTGGAEATQTLRLDVDGRTVHSQSVHLPEGGFVEKEVDLPPGERVEALLDGDDLLGADNHAYATASPRPGMRILLAGPEDLFLERLLATIPGVTLERRETARPAPGMDLAVYNQVPVPADPGAPWLAIAPPGGAPGLSVNGAVDQPAVALVQAEHPLLSGLDLSSVGISTAQKLSPRADDEVLVGAEETALFVRGSRDGRAFAYLGFTLSDSNLPLTVAFPVLADRLLTDLSGATAAPGDVRAGQPLPLPPGGAAVAVLRPGGTRVEVPAGGAPPITDRTGFYRIESAGKPEQVVAVNAAAGESALAPVDTLPVRPRAPIPGERAPRGEVSLLRWVIFALAIVLAAEFLVGRRSRGVPRRQWRAGLAARAIIAACLLGALLGISLPRGGGRVATVFLVDASDSMGAGGKEAALEWVRQALAKQGKETKAAVVLFGGDARVEASLASKVRLSDAAVQIDASRTDLAGALRLAGALLPDDARRRVVLVSDGRATEGDAALEARRLKEDGIDLDVHTVAAAEGPDAAIARIDSPGAAHKGESFTVRAAIASTRAGPARVTLQKDGVSVEERVVDLVVGETVVEFNQVAGDPGLSRYRVEVSGAGDTVSANDAGYAAVAVEGPPKVLIAEGTAGEGSALAAALRAGGLDVDVKKAAELPALDKLGTYSATVLVDVDAHSLSGQQIHDLTATTRDLGRGLVVLGGDHSYALGGYRDSELEQLLPVVSDITDPKRKQSVAEVLAIDSSGSMGACHCAEGNNGIATGGNFMNGGVNKTDIAKAGAARAIEALSATDQVGVLAFNTEQHFLIPLQQVPDKREIDKGLGKLTPAGGTELRQPLKTAADALRGAKASLKHIVLFTDGFTAENALDDLVTQARQLADEGITVSVLATGEGASQELKAVADAGRGRFYPGRDLSEIPQLMAQEVLLASRDFVNEGEFFPKVVGHGPAVDQLQESPSLLGYLATTAKPTAEVQLRIGAEDDPLLASWRAGLGRVTAWTSDASQRWSKNWAAWGGYKNFWAAVVKDTLPLGGSEGTAVTAKIDGERLEIAAESEQPWAEGATAVARVAGPGGSSQEVRLERTAGGRFAVQIDATAPGSYSVGVSVDGPAGRLASGVALASQSYSPEYRPGPAQPEELARLSELAGGRGPIEAAAAFDTESLSKGHGRRTLTGWLLLLAALLWPLDCALRRLSFTAAAPLALAARFGSDLGSRLRGLFRLPRVGSLPAAGGPRRGRRRDKTPARPQPTASSGPPTAGSPPTAPPGPAPSAPPASAPPPGAPPPSGRPSASSPAQEPEPTPAAPAPSDTLDRLLQRKRRGGR